MGLFWKAPIHKTVALLDKSGKRELFWYGVTIGQVGFGFLASEKRQPTQRTVGLKRARLKAKKKLLPPLQATNANR